MFANLIKSSKKNMQGV